MKIADRLRRKPLVLYPALLGVLLLLTLALLVKPGGSPTGSPHPWDDPDYANSGVPGDVDGDGKVSVPEQKALDVTRQSAETLADTVIAQKGGDTLLLTPAGENWWEFITRQAPGLGLAESPHPAGVAWYALTEGRAFEPLSDVNTYYQAVHVSFDDRASATGWVEGLAAEGHGAPAMFTIRDRVVTVTPSWVDAKTEPYPETDTQTLDAIEARLGLWRIDFSEHAKNRAREAADPVAYEQFWNATGITGTWTATSPRPDLAWVGALEGFDAKRVQPNEAVAAVNLSMYECRGARECRSDLGMAEAISHLYLVDAEGASGGEEWLAPADLPSNLAVSLTLAEAFRGAANGSYSLEGVGKTEYVVADNGTMSLRLDFDSPDPEMPEAS